MLAFHLVIAGFTQKKSKWHGPARLTEELIDILPPRHRVELYSWNENWKEVAARLNWIAQMRNKRPLVNIYGYSWGGGWGAPQLANNLAAHDIDVQWMVLSDPVYRHKYFLGQWRAYSNMFGWDTPITISHNVKNLKSFYQVQNFPRAHRLKAHSNTKVFPRVELVAYHSAMDDEESWHNACKVASKELVLIQRTDRAIYKDGRP